MAQLLLLFLVVPIVELALLIEVGQYIGTLPTLAIIALTAIVGSYLARQQGLGVWRQLQAELSQGRLPAGPIFDGVLILMAGAVLITPGILTDAAGFVILIPTTRELIKAYLRRRFERAVRDGRARVHIHVGGRDMDDFTAYSEPPEPPLGPRITDREKDPFP